MLKRLSCLVCAARLLMAAQGANALGDLSEALQNLSRKVSPAVVKVQVTAICAGPYVNTLDAGALQSLQEMGLAELAGVTVGRCFDLDTQERFVEHPLNGATARWTI